MKQLITTLVLLLFITSTQAQRLFSEGVITYKVYTKDSKANIGEYTIYVKGSYIKRSLNLNNGYSNTTIYNGKDGTSATLINQVQGTNYALMLTKEEVSGANKQFAGASYSFEKGKEKIAGYLIERGSATYQSGKKVPLAVTRDLRSEDYHLLTMFPDLNGIPMEFEMNNDRSSMRFVADKIEIRNVGSEEFIIPKNYKIVTKKELEGK